VSSLSHGWPPATATLGSSLKASKVFEEMRPFPGHTPSGLILMPNPAQKPGVEVNVELVRTKEVSLNFSRFVAP
jgi:hypothetical protein